MSEQRTPEELKDRSFNYYIAFGIPKTANEAQIKECLIALFNGASAGSPQLRRFLELKKDVEAIMLRDAVFNASSGEYIDNKGGRQAECDAAKRFMIDEHVAAFTSNCRFKPMLFRSDIAIAVAKSKWFTEDELTAALAPLIAQGVTIVDNMTCAMPFTQYDELDAQLKIAGYTDIFSFLNDLDKDGAPITRKSPAKAIADKSRIANGKIVARTSAKGTASQAACGTIGTIFATEASRLLYLQYMDTRKSVWDKLALLSITGVRSIEYAQYLECFVILKKALGLSDDEISNLLAGACRFRQISVVCGASQVDSSFSLVTCPACKKPYNDASKPNLCPNCQAKLRYQCWNCGNTVVASEGKTCTSCGVTEATEASFHTCCSQLNALFSQVNPDLRKIDMHISDLKMLMGKSIADSKINKMLNEYMRKRSDAESSHIAKLKEQSEHEEKQRMQRETAYSNAKKDLEDMIREKRLYAAREAAEKMQREFPTYNTSEIDGYVVYITKQHNLINELIDQLKMYMSAKNEQMIIELVVRILALCSDCNYVSQVVRAYPPCKPTGLEARQSGASVTLTWNALDNETYTVIKKVGSVPSNMNDGQVCAKSLSVGSYTDKLTVSTVLTYYAVFSERFGVFSMLSVLATPCYVLLPVSSVRQKFSAGSISVEWHCPNSVSRIIVRKRQGMVAPQSDTDGEEVKVNSNNTGFSDNNASGVQSYRIVCVYNINGKEKQSAPICISLQIESGPTPFSINKVTRLRGSNVIEFECSSDEIKSAYLCPKASIQSGVVMESSAMSAALSQGTPIQLVPKGNRLFAMNIPENRLGFVYIIAEKSNFALASLPFPCTTKPALNNVTASLVGNTLKITGNADAAVANVYAVYGAGYVNTYKQLPSGYTCVTLNESIIKTSSANISLPEGNFKVTLFADFVLEKRTAYSAPIKLEGDFDTRRSHIVYYRIAYRQSPTKPFKLKLDFESDAEITLPRAHIEAMDGLVPYNVGDGENICDIDEITLKRKAFSDMYAAGITISIPPISLTKKLGYCAEKSQSSLLTFTRLQ